MGSTAHDEEKRRRLHEWRQQEQAERDEWQREFHERHTTRYFEQIEHVRRHARARERLQEVQPEPVRPERPPGGTPTSVPGTGFSLRDGEDWLFAFGYSLVIISALVFVVFIALAVSRDSSAGAHTTQPRVQVEDAEIGGDDPCLDTVCRGD